MTSRGWSCALGDGYDAGTVAAAFGGVTSVLDMRIQERGKGATAVAAVVRGLEDASRKAVIDFSFHAGLTNPSMETLAEIPELVAMGIPSFKFFLTYPNWHIRVDLGFLYEAFRVVRANNGIAAVHCEDDQIIEHLKQKYVSADGRTFIAMPLRVPILRRRSRSACRHTRPRDRSAGLRRACVKPQGTGSGEARQEPGCATLSRRRTPLPDLHRGRPQTGSCPSRAICYGATVPDRRRHRGLVGGDPRRIDRLDGIGPQSLSHVAEDQGHAILCRPGRGPRTASNAPFLRASAAPRSFCR